LRSARKRKSWPVYLTSLRARIGCPTVLLVVAPHPAVARWCAQPISLGHPGFVLQPLVAGPSAIPLILGKQAAGRDPELAVLSALAHGNDPELAPALFEAVVSSAQRLDKERFGFCIDLAVSAFGGAARSALEAFMQSGSYQYQSVLVRKLVGHGLEKGLEKRLAFLPTTKKVARIPARLRMSRTAPSRPAAARASERGSPGAARSSSPPAAGWGTS
jgi:hypothetical protein